MRLHSGGQRERAAVVKVGCGGPHVAQRGHVDADQRCAQAPAAAGLQGADVAQRAGVTADGEACAGVATGAVGVGEHHPAGDGGGRERAVGVAVGAALEGGERAEVGGQRIEVGAEAGLAVAERGVARACVELRVRHQAGAAGKGADLAFEVLHLVEVGAPVHEALRHAGAAGQRRRVAQAFAEVREVPGAAVVAGVAVATGAAHVAVARQARVAGVVEEPLAKQHLRTQALSARRAHGGEGRELRQALPDQRPQVDHAGRAVHEVLHVQARAVGRDGQGLRRTADVELHQLAAAESIHHRHLAAGLEGHEQISAARVVGRGRAEARVVVVDAAGVVLGQRGHVDARTDGAHRVLEVQRLAPAQRAAFDVVLLGRHPGSRTVGRDDGRSQVVRDA